MTEAQALQSPKAAKPGAAEHVDVLIVGAGISGVGAAYYLNKHNPGTSYTILEAEESYGGTWWTHRYPGIRSDSDLHTFGYSFKPWVGPPIATAEEILAYMGEVIDENSIGGHIHYRNKITNADWSYADSLWTVTAQNLDTGKTRQLTCNFLYMCQGYYRHNQGYMPEWDGVEDFKGQLVHSEEWDPSIDYTGKNVVVIGSGASAATIVPAMAGVAKHVTMLQRSPTYFRTGRNAIEIAEELRQLQMDEEIVHEVTRRKIMFEQAAFTKMCIEKPDAVKKMMLDNIQGLLGPDYDVGKHFTPSYRPWRQRIAFVPDADLFKGIADGHASVVTDEIDRFVENGILLKSGEVLEADLIVASTGFNMNIMGDIAFTIDGKPLDWHQTVTYRGTMFTGVPNLAWVFGYFRASWTLRSELVAAFVCRMLNHMKATGAKSIEVGLRDQDKGMQIMDWMDEEDFNPHYLERAVPLLPRRGDKHEWQHTQNYWREKDEFPAIDLNGEEFIYRRSAHASLAAE